MNNVLRTIARVAAATLLLPLLVWASPELEEPPNPLKRILRHRLEAGDLENRMVVRGRSIHSPKLVLQFYENRLYEPAWTSNGGLLPLADLLAELVGNADQEGLAPKDYHSEALQSIIQEASEAEKKFRTSWIADAEILWTDAALTLAAHCLSGKRHPQSFDREWFAAPRRADVVRIVHDAVEAEEIEEVFKELLPPQRGYWRLKKALRRYRKLAPKGGWPRPKGAVGLRLGSKGRAVRALRERMVLEGDLAGSAEKSREFNAELELAVKSFQKRYGMPRSGIVDEQTLAEMEVPIEDRIRQIKANMERWRWLPASMGDPHIRVNLADYNLSFYNGGFPKLSMRVIVGKTYRRTPVFSDRMTYLVLNPSWTVPKRLAVEDEIPKILREPDYFSKRKVRVYEGWESGAKEVDPKGIDWKAVSAETFPYRLKFGPGLENPLGRVKFMFPNAHDIYFHDSPQREKFGAQARTFSSGCIRLEDPLALAAKVLAGRKDWDSAKLEKTLAEGRERAVRLPKPISIHILYWTAWADAEGRVHFRGDIYGRDARVLESLSEPL